jgi:hypothetical protein
MQSSLKIANVIDIPKKIKREMQLSMFSIRNIRFELLGYHSGVSKHSVLVGHDAAKLGNVFEAESCPKRRGN